MTWVSDYKYTWLQSLSMRVLKSGHVPQHIAFVMDGNRRYAKSEHLEKIEGHSRGFDKLADCLRWCLDMGIKEVTTFAFSIENFNRSQDEVQGLFDLARQKFGKLKEETANLKKNGVCIKILGNVSLLPEDLQKLIAECMLKTEENNKLFLNVAFSYTSRDEITQAVETVLKHGNDFLEPQDISERLLNECMYNRHSSPPDLLFRTSGETRISDFLMWQLEGTVLYFTKILWPQITIWNFFAGIFAYQRAALQLQPYRNHLRLQKAQVAKTSDFYSQRVQRFLQFIDSHRRNVLLKLAGSPR